MTDPISLTCKVLDTMRDDRKAFYKAIVFYLY